MNGRSIAVFDNSKIDGDGDGDVDMSGQRILLSRCWYTSERMVDCQKPIPLKVNFSRD